MFSMTRRSFLKGLAALGGFLGLTKVATAKPVPVDPKPSHLVRLQFEKHSECDDLCVVNGPEALNGIPLEERPTGLHASWKGISFKWSREGRAWIDKKDAQWLRWKLPKGPYDSPFGENIRDFISWGEVIIIEEVTFSTTRNTACVTFMLKPCEATRKIEYPSNFHFSQSRETIRQEVERAFADTGDPRPGLPIDDYIGPKK